MDVESKVASSCTMQENKSHRNNYPIQNAGCIAALIDNILLHEKKKNENERLGCKNKLKALGEHKPPPSFFGL